ncbi:hypothetical protein [Pseudomonas libanensis]|uniref:hypothetical protein n=1 Tax=Pseudomonas libanensis TaxID=75588 RepID=UPI002F90BBA9
MLAIQQVCNGDSGAACKKVKFTEAGKFAGSTSGGYVGGEIGKYASGPICLALGVSTGVGGVACLATIIGAGAWIGTNVGERGGEYMGEKIHEINQL